MWVLLAHFNYCVGFHYAYTCLSIFPIEVAGLFPFCHPNIAAVSIRYVSGYTYVLGFLQSAHLDRHFLAQESVRLSEAS